MRILITIFTYFVVSFIAHVSYASKWPVFIPPNKEFLLEHHYIDTQSCPAGKGILSTNILINIQQHLCRNFCPGIWNWISSSDNQCADLEHDFHFKNFDFYTHENKNGTPNFSVIVASFGNKNAQEPAFKFIFTSQPGDYWTCYEMNPQEHFISCSNDI